MNELGKIGQKRRDEIVGTMRRRDAALTHLATSVVFSGGKNVAWSTRDAEHAAILMWGLYRTTWRDPSDEKMQVFAVGKLFDMVERQLFIGNGMVGGGCSIIGFDEAIGCDANVYGALDRRVHRWWQPTVIDPGKPTPLSLDALRSDVAKIGADVAFVDVDTYKTLKTMLPDNRTLDGCKFVQSLGVGPSLHNQPSIYYVQSKHVLLHVLPDRTTTDDRPVLGLERLAAAVHYEVMSSEEVEAEGDAAGGKPRVEAMLYVQLEVTRPDLCGVRRNIAAG